MALTPTNYKTELVSGPQADPAQAERGVILPIIAVMALAVIGALAILGLETARFKNIATVLRSHNERICRTVVKGAMTPAEAARAFRTEVRNLPPLGNGIQIDVAQLIVPLPIDGDISGTFYDFSSPCGTLTPFDPFPSGSGPPETPFASLSATTVPFDCSAGAPPALKPGMDCTLRYDICTGTTPHPEYPSLLWSDIRSAGNTVGCELEAEVTPLFQFLGATPRRVVAKVAWAIPLFPTPPFLEDRTGAGTPTQDDFAGLSLGIAPQLTTWAGSYLSDPSANHLDDRFKFDTTLYPQIAPIDPRRILSPGGGPPPRRFSMQNPARVLSGYGAVADLPAILNGSPFTSSSGPEDLITACFNPAGLVRNIITSTLLELAARHGESRNLTEVAFINPRHRGWTTPNRPVVAVRFGQDLAEERYQHPFVTYDGGPIPSSNSPFGQHAGFTLPWMASPPGPPTYFFGANETTTQTNALLTQQLRMCLHLYRDTLSPRQGLPLHSSGGLIPLLPPQFDLAPSLAGGGGGGPPFAQNWDYPEPWSGVTPTSGERLLTAAELAYATGSVQRCPLRIPSSSPPLGTEFAVCPKETINPADPFNPLDDLLPDLVAYLTLQADGRFVSLAGEHPYYSPGLREARGTNGLAITTTSLVNIDQSNPMLGDPGGTPLPRPRSIVTLFVHKGLPGAGLSEPTIVALRDLVRAINQQRRPVVVVFIPTTQVESNLASNYCLALDLDPSCQLITSGTAPSNANAGFNRLILLSPFNADYGTTYTQSPAGAPLQEWASFQAYWSDLLTDAGTTADLSAYRLAIELFFTSIVRHEPIL